MSSALTTATGRLTGRIGVSRRWSRIARQPHPAGEVGGELLGLVGQRPAGEQAAVGHQLVAVEARSGDELEGAGLVSEELARRQERDVLDGDDRPTGGRRRGHLGEALDAHHTRQHRRAVDAVMVEEALLDRIERRCAPSGRPPTSTR